MRLLALVRESSRSLTLGVFALFLLILLGGESRSDRAVVERQDAALFELLLHGLQPDRPHRPSPGG